MQTITTYTRSTNRHKWRYWYEWPTELKDAAIEYMRQWYRRLNPRFLPRQIGYVISERSDNGCICQHVSRKCNDPHVRIID